MCVLSYTFIWYLGSKLRLSVTCSSTHTYAEPFGSPWMFLSHKCCISCVLYMIGSVIFFWVFETGFLCIYLAGFELKRTAQVLGSKACVTIPAGFIFRNGLTL